MNYRKIYDSLIDKRRQDRPEGYTENHHIHPTTQGGPDVSENRVRLTASEHLFAHLLLVKIYPEHSGLRWAATAMSGMKKYGSRKYAWLREKFSASQSERMMGIPKSKEQRKKQSIATKGIPKSEETCQKIRISLKGRKITEEVLKKRIKIIVTEETREKLRKIHKGIPKSEEHRNKMIGGKRSKETCQKISDSSKGKPKSEEHCKNIKLAKQKIKGRLCEYCRKPWHARWHGERCREKPTR